MNITLFAGPSIDHCSLRAILPTAEILSPVSRGDIEVVLSRDCTPDIFGIIDGKFLHSMSISPKEIISALSLGTKVFGSSSMGALRAVELAPYGMVGVGKIYHAFLDGEVDADDEVAIVFDSETLKALCVPMMNFRFSVRELLANHAINAFEADLIINVAKSLYFPERTHLRVARLLGDFGVSEIRCNQIFESLKYSVDQKREDALELAFAIKSFAESPSRT